MNDLMARAAQARALEVSRRSARPVQRRSAQDPEARAWTRAEATLELREQPDGDALDFHGVASVTERAYDMWDMFGPYAEVVSAGAFAETLNRSDLDVPLVLAHDSLRRIARTTNGSLFLAETDDGLVVDAPNLDARDADVAYIAPKLRSGLIDEMSFMFRIEAGTWSPDYSEYRIERVELHRGDVAIVGYGANPHTSADLRTAPPAADLRAAMLALAIGI